MKYGKTELIRRISDIVRNGWNNNAVRDLVESLWRDPFSMRTSGFVREGGTDAVISVSTLMQLIQEVPFYSITFTIGPKVKKFDFYQFRQILTYMKTYLKILIKKADIGNALFLLNSISDLRKALLASSPARAEDLLQTIRLITQETDLDIIRDIARPERIEDPRPLFEFLVWFGPRTLPTAIEACEAAVDPLWREACVEYLRVMVRDCLSETAAQIRNRKPELIQTLITLLGDRGDKKAILHLADLARSGNPEIRLEAVRTLGGLSHDLARKLTLEFLLDPDERIRIEAGQAARLESDENALARMIQIVSRKNFLARSSTERGAMLLALGRSNTGPAAKALETLVRKRRLLGGERLRETRLLAVSGLAVMNIPQAREALAAGVKVSNQAVATACAQALKRRGERHREAE